jgi:hypothetical protein
MNTQNTIIFPNYQPVVTQENPTDFINKNKIVEQT